ncbi:MAG: MoxR family ATPase [Halieaceae bacterium]|jgi:MoxR-like ATPase|uniref:MoxR family ATPase n=2 Tax=Candidatus Seongchinamella marina TaxID=2518990 RepID=A0ABT3SZ27_9GAMM|nr:MoxR family ATPase [Candidatus Seongchinamella marina]MBT3410006.1 MoxR family ATPase [Halieaceae bacterium]MBT6125611.1 MoxR family ATPase [Halieaceae bacterium]MBT7717997.1 MoxR family ATPase [Halieaceae bacterium]MCX2975249.1 MoxR family ATPase [Candidatus Seongchinamella marina]
MMEQMARSVIGQEEVVRTLALALLCNGNVLLEGLPGTAKTRSIKTLSRVLQASLGRIQFTPDLLPSDVTGNEVYQDNQGVSELIFQEGPIFNELILADEINRAPAKVQAALLEAMEERQVTVAGKTYPLPPLFMVLATQNPIEQEGTYPLPEAQMDRFLMKISVDYPDNAAELSIVRMLQAEEAAQQEQLTMISQDHIFAGREVIGKMTLSAPVEQYIVDLVMATRQAADYSKQLATWIDTGSSPRATIALHRTSRASAWLDGRDHVTPEDVRSVLHAIMRHRLILSYDALADRVSPDDVIDEIITQVAVG